MLRTLLFFTTETRASFERFSSMRDGQGCLLPVRRCYGLPEEDRPFMFQWFLPQIRRAEVAHHLHDVKSSNRAEERRKKPRRAKPKTSKLGSKALDASTAVQEGAGRACRIASCQEDAVTAGEMVAVQEGAVTAGETVAVWDDADVISALPECSSNQDEKSAGKTDEVPNDEEAADTSYLPGLDDSVALRCLAFLPRTQHWRLAMLSRRHRDLVRDSLLLKLRHEYRIVEQWICIYTSGNNGWTAFDPKQNLWRNLPHANVDPNFDLSDKESLSAGTHLLWLGREVFDFACYKYDLVSNSWERGPSMVNPRCLFASASCGEFAFVAGGFTVAGMQFNVLNSAERYNSLKGVWEPLPHMATPRHKCSGFFMDGKFYVIGGKTRNHEPLTSGEEYDPEKNVWRTIENMYSAPDSTPSFEPSPPLVAVAGNQLYAIESSSNLLKVYEKHMNTWKVLGPVPVRADFCNGWGLAFKALGDQLFVIGGHRTSTQEREGVAVFSWRPQPGASAPEWQLVNSRVTGIGNFLFNCAVMAC